MWTDLPKSVTEALDRLCARGFSAFLVGGCVRDILRGVMPHDYDLTTSATPQETKAVFGDKHVIETGIKHGTVTVLLDGMPLEITTFRRDGTYSDGRHPDGVAFATDIREDLSRRDFTVNAMAWSPQTGVVDLFGGREDLQNGVIRCVGEPLRRFHEDALRILRGIRFASQLRFSVEEQTARAMKDCVSLLEHVSAERIAREFFLLLCGPGAEAVLTEYPEIVAFFVPELCASPEQYARAVCAVSAVSPALPLRLAAFFHCLGPTPKESASMAATILKRLRAENKLIRSVSCLISEYETVLQPMDDPTALRLLQRVPSELVESLLALARGVASIRDKSDISLQRAEETANRLHRLLVSSPCLSVGELAITGRELLQLGCPPGEAVGRLLHTLLEEVTDGIAANAPKELLQRAQKILQESAHAVLKND